MRSRPGQLEDVIARNELLLYWLMRDFEVKTTIAMRPSTVKKYRFTLNLKQFIPFAFVIASRRSTMSACGWCCYSSRLHCWS